MSKPRNRPQLQITMDTELRDSLTEWAGSHQDTLKAFVEEQQGRLVVKLGVGSAIEYACTQFLTSEVSTQDNLEQIGRLEAERDMLITQRDSLLYHLPPPTDSELSTLTAQLRDAPESITAFIKRTRCRREYLAWVLSTHMESLDGIGVKLGEPHAGSKGSGLWLMTGQVVATIWREVPSGKKLRGILMDDEETPAKGV